MRLTLKRKKLHWATANLNLGVTLKGITHIGFSSRLDDGGEKM